MKYINIRHVGDFDERPRDSYLRIVGNIIIGSNAGDFPVETWDTSACRDMGAMFQICKNVPVGISTWDTSACKKMNYMFTHSKFGSENCDASGFRQSISGWDTSGVRTMANMFEHSKKLPANISDWDVSAVRSMECMFIGSGNVPIPNISAWHISKCYIYCMFLACYKLNQPLLFHSINYDVNVFQACYSLKI